MTVTLLGTKRQAHMSVQSLPVLCCLSHILVSKIHAIDGFQSVPDMQQLGQRIRVTFLGIQKRFGIWILNIRYPVVFFDTPKLLLV